MSTAAERLEAAIEEVGKPDDVPDRAWAVTDRGSADWALRKLGKVFEEIRQVETVAEAHITAAVKFRDGELDRLRPQVENWTSLLAVYHRHVLAEDPEGPRTIKFPSGARLIARKQTDKVEIEDVAALMEWARTHLPAAIRPPQPGKETLVMDVVKEAVLKNGEVIPGVTPITDEVKYTAEVPDPEVEA